MERVSCHASGTVVCTTKKWGMTMKYRVKTITRDFSPSEAARVTGVSTALQRDWRRRGVIEGRSDGWNRFQLEDVISMAVMRAFTQSGISIETAAVLSSLAILPVIATLSRWSDTAVFEGDTLPENEQDRVRSGAVKGASEDEQFSFVALPERAEDPIAARLDALADCERLMSKNRSFHGIVMDHYGLAHHIASNCDLPIIRYLVEVIASDEETAGGDE